MELISSAPSFHRFIGHQTSSSSFLHRFMMSFLAPQPSKIREQILEAEWHYNRKQETSSIYTGAVSCIVLWSHFLLRNLLRSGNRFWKQNDITTESKKRHRFIVHRTYRSSFLHHLFKLAMMKCSTRVPLWLRERLKREYVN